MLFIPVVIVVVVVQIVGKVEALLLNDHRLKFQTSPLIGGPPWLPLHCKVIVGDSYVFDFIPLNATSKETIKQLISLRAVPAEARILRLFEPQKTTINVEEKGKGEISKANKKKNKFYAKEIDDVERAIKFCKEYKEDLHLINNNCWSFAIDLLWELRYPKNGKSDDVT